jgi:hypothetical protein
MAANKQAPVGTRDDARVLSDNLQAITEHTMAILKEARETGSHSLALAAIARLERQIELHGRLSGRLNEAPAVNILVTPEWTELRAAILAALEAHPEAKVAVAGVLNAKA